MKEMNDICNDKRLVEIHFNMSFNMHFKTSKTQFFILFMFKNKKNIGGFVFLSLLINFFYYNVKFKFQYKMFKNSTKLDKKNLYTIIQYYSNFNINFSVLLIILNNI